jgi:dolichyl-phosphate beta-glucosyltransferase
MASPWQGWIFDIEMLILAELLHVPMVEVGVQWEEVAGSKMSLMRDALIMLKDLFIIRYNYTIGAWHPRERTV